MSHKLEQEVKFLLKDPESVEERLISLGARLKQPRILETNLRFDTPNKRLSSVFQTLRLRQDQVCRLTWKGAGDTSGAVRAREELEVEVSDLETTREILEALGFEIFLIYEKYRRAYMLDDVEISLDEMPFGIFCEIEGPDIQSQKTAALLSLPWESSSKLSYLEIFESLKQKLGLTVRDLTFKSFKNIRVSTEDFGVKLAFKQWDVKRKIL